MIKQIAPEDIKIGMFVTAINLSWFKTPFLTHKFYVKSQSQIEKIKKLNLKEISIDTAKGIDINAPQETTAQQKPLQKTEIISADLKKIEKNKKLIKEHIAFHNEVTKAKEIRTDMVNVIGHVINDIKLGKTINTDQIMSIAETMVESIYRNNYAITSLARLKNYNKYTFNHSINVAIMASSFGRYIDMPREDLTVMGMGGLLHDLGKMKISEDILNKKGPLTLEELEEIKMHVKHTVELLSHSKDIPAAVIEIAAQHHERGDGSGYPLGLKECEIGKFGQICAIVDLYDNLTSDRGNRPALLPGAAMRLLLSFSSQSLYKPYVEKFANHIGIFPIGSYVLLSTGEVAAVVSNNPNNHLTPIVRKVINNHGVKINSATLIDLADSDDKNNNKKIERAVNEREYDLPLYSELEAPNLE